MGVKYNDPRLFIAGLVASVAALSVVIAGRFVTVNVPQPVSWASAPTVCPELAIDDAALAAAMHALTEAGVPVRLGALPCPKSAAIHLGISIADVDRIGHPDPTMDGETPRGAFERKVIGDLVVDCSAFIIAPDDGEAIAHEIAHCLGYDHARFAPSGHLMNKEYNRISLKDLRGIGRSRR